MKRGVDLNNQLLYVDHIETATATANGDWKMTIRSIRIGLGYVGIVLNADEKVITSTDVKDFQFDAYHGARMLRYKLRYEN